MFQSFYTSTFEHSVIMISLPSSTLSDMSTFMVEGGVFKLTIKL